MAGRQNFLGLDHRGGRRRIVGAGHQVENLPLFVAAWVADLQLEHEAVNLRFRQRVGAFVFDGILRGQHEERLLQLERSLANRDLLFLHRFQQGALHLGRGAIDLIGQH